MLQNDQNKRKKNNGAQDLTFHLNVMHRITDWFAVLHSTRIKCAMKGKKPMFNSEQICVDK